MDRKNTDKLMDMLGLNETLDKMAIASKSAMVWSCFEKRWERCFKERHCSL